MRTSTSLLCVLMLGGCEGALSSTDGEDAGAREASVALDAGAGVDAPSFDAAPVDAPPDAWAPDAYEPPDAATYDAGPYFAAERQTVRPIGYMGAPQGFWEYLPPSYAETGTGSPLLLFFHGIGENGPGTEETLSTVLRNGPPNLISRNRWPRDRPFIVLSPQHSAGGCPSASSIAALLSWAREHYNVDESRLYLTGLSCGGIGVNSYLARDALTTDVAAVVGISGSWSAAWSAHGCALGRVAIWGIHGDADANGGTPPSGTRDPITSLIACPEPPREEALLNMLPGVGHSGAAWNDTYSGANGLDVYEFLLRHTRP